MIGITIIGSNTDEFVIKITNRLFLMLSPSCKRSDVTGLICSGTSLAALSKIIFHSDFIVLM